MYITVTVKIKSIYYDIKIDRRQKIYVALEILKSSGNTSVQFIPAFYKSYQNQRIVSAYNTFEQSKIYSGDVLEAII